MNFDFIAYPLGKFLLFIYNTISFHNYGLAIIFFTFFVRLVLLPLTLKQYKSSAKMQEIQPIIADIQKRYKDDKEKLNQEMMKVYQEKGYNPASGCLPLLIQMPILMALYWVIIQPLKFMLGKSTEQINAIVKAATDLGANLVGYQKELVALNYFNEHQDKLDKVTGYLSKSELIDFNNFLGLHLGKIATYKPNILFGSEAYIYLPLFLLAIVAVVTTYLSTKLAMPPKQNNNNNNSQMAMANSMTNSMMYIGPLMTLMFAFQLPGGVVLYWMIGYVFAILQQLYINKYILKKGKPKQVDGMGREVVEATAVPVQAEGDKKKGSAEFIQLGQAKTGAGEKSGGSGKSGTGSSGKSGKKGGTDANSYKGKSKK